MSMKSRGVGAAKSTISKKVSNPMDKMSVNAASSKSAVPGFACGGKAMAMGGKLPMSEIKSAKKAGKKVTKDIEYDDKHRRFAKGGLVKSSSAINGVAERGKTRGKTC